MAANILLSERASQMSAFVVRAFVKMRATLSETAILAAKLGALEKEATARLESHEKAIVELMQQFLTILNPPAEEKYPDAEKREMGFHVREKKGRYDAPKRAR